ncbi:uncharacterized protein LOC135170629 [Diachasmimorpha longicaudata]|uniref:uncharacterized protein LOC135170629 n=1 Tax=Diachasmimorpha longicaudata TaxID=58733 RepID=UPI0030B8D563
MTAKVTPAKPKAKDKIEKPKEKKKKASRYKLKLMGWLKTPADWERFNAWAKINSLPRKIPEPAPVVRTSKPLWKMKKRIDLLSKPVKHPDLSLLYRLDQNVSKKALMAKASKRIKIIAKPVIKPMEMPREFPLKIKKSALNYQATDNIMKISQPKDFRTEECKGLAETLRAKEMELEELDDEDKMKQQRELRRIVKKAMICPDLLSMKHIHQLITEGGVYRTALTYKSTSWLDFLAIPSYRFLRLRKDDTAEKWKENYLNEMETRGKRALQEQFDREEKRRELEATALAQAERQTSEEPADLHHQSDEEGQEDDVMQLEPVETEAAIEAAGDDSEEEELIDDDDQEVEEAAADDATEPVAAADDATEPVAAADDATEPVAPADDATEPVAPAVEVAEAEEESAEKETVQPQDVLQPKAETKTKRTRLIPRPTPLADDEESKKRRAERNAWRFEPPPWKDDDPLKATQLGPKKPASPRMEELAKPHIRKDRNTRKNPFDVKKSALSSSVPARMTELAKPNHPREPVQKRQKRELNKYGQPIFPIPSYGKNLPPVPPYKERDCDPADAKTPKEVENAEEIELKPDPIVLEPTIDPYFDPEGAERQLEARNAIKNKKEENQNSEDTEK